MDQILNLIFDILPFIGAIIVFCILYVLVINFSNRDILREDYYEAEFDSKQGEEIGDIDITLTFLTKDNGMKPDCSIELFLCDQKLKRGALLSIYFDETFIHKKVLNEEDEEELLIIETINNCFNPNLNGQSICYIKLNNKEFLSAPIYKL